MLNATDIDSNDSTLIFTVGNVKHGYFDKISNQGAPITSFTQEEIMNHEIRFTHDGSELAASYEVKVSDGELETSYQAAVVNYISINDQTPVLRNNQLTIHKGETVVLNSGILSATDADTDDTMLIFTINNVQHGRFEKVSNPGVRITGFTQQEIINGDIQFIHDGSEIAPSYEVKISDGELESLYQLAAINFENKNTPNNNILPFVIGAIVLGTCALVSASVIGAVGFFAVKQNQKSKKQQLHLAKPKLEEKELEPCSSREHHQ